MDAILADLMRRYATGFPGRIRACYVIGSYADGSATPLSDLDVVILFDGHLGADDAARAEVLGRACARLPAIRLDLTVSGANDATWEKPYVKLAGLLVYGSDIRAAIPDPPVDAAYLRRSLAYATGYLQEYLRGVDRLTFPLTYPDPADAFYGYAAVRRPDWYPPGTTQGLRELVNTSTLLARSLVSLDTGRFVASKAASVALYRAGIGDPWAGYLETLYEHGKRRWGYQVPEGATDRRLLRDLCRQTLGFEAHFFARYRAFLEDLLRAEDPATREYAAARLAEISPAK